MSMIEMMILGFLGEQPMCGYTLRKKMEQLQGYARTFSDGAIYPATKRLVDAGFIRQHDESLDGRQRRQFTLLEAGKQKLIQELKDANGFYITDFTRWTVILTFLSVLDEQVDRDAVLRRRYDYLRTANVHYFYCESGRALETKEIMDPYRRGIIEMHDASLEAELKWLRNELDRQ